MDFLGFFNFAFTCFHLLALPLFALGYPLCASIRAIETKSNYHMRKLVTYWIIFSLISLLELAIVKLIEWIPLWPYIKLGTICWLVLPQFNGAHYCYKSFIQPCLSVNLEEAMRKLYKRQKTSVEKDNFLSVAERYVTENGTEALEKLIASKGSRTGFGVDDIKAVAEAEKLEMPLMVKGSTTDFGVEKVRKVEETEKKEMLLIAKLKGSELKVDHKDINRMEQPEENAPVPENSAKNKSVAAVEVKEMTIQPAATKEALEKLIASKGSRTGFDVGDIKAVAEAEKRDMPWLVKQPNLLHLKGPATSFGAEETKTVAEADKKEMPQMVKGSFVEKIKAVAETEKKEVLQTAKVNEMTKPLVPPVATDEALPAKNPSEKIQKEWTCAVCQVTTSCEANLNSHLTGKKHKAKCEQLKSKTSKQTTKLRASPFKSASKKNSNAGSTNLKNWCPYCSITFKCETDFLAHHYGKKHKARVQEMAVYPAGVQG